MKKIKIKFSNELFKLKNFLIDKFKKLNKFIESKIIKFINKYFPNKLNKYKKFKNIKFINISNLSMSIILFIALLFIYLFYVSIPTLYDKGALQKDITDKLIKEFKIDFSLSSNIRYFILPSPHFLVENVKIFDENLKDPKELSQIKKLKIYISQKNLFDRNNLKITKILIEDANFIIQKKNTKFYNDYIKDRFSKKKVIIKNSNFFLQDNKNIIALVPIKNINLFYDEKKLANQIIAKGKVFKIPFDINWYKNFTNEKKSVTLLKFKKLDLKIKNKSLIKDKKYIAKNSIFFRNAKLHSNFQIENNIIRFKSEDSKIVNSNLDYNGQIDIDPFHLKLEINLDKLNIIKFLISSFNFIKSVNMNFLFNENLSTKIGIKSNNIHNKLFDFAEILINFDNGKINFNNTLLISKKVGSLKLTESNLDFIDEKLIFKGSFNFNVTDQKKFYTVFQIPKKNRKLLKNIFFDIYIDSSNDKLNINNFKINDKKSIANENTVNIINQYNNKKKNEIQNWINLKNFTREIFNSYSG